MQQSEMGEQKRARLRSFVGGGSIGFTYDKHRGGIKDFDKPEENEDKKQSSPSLYEMFYNERGRLPSLDLNFAYPNCFSLGSPLFAASIYTAQIISTILILSSLQFNVSFMFLTYSEIMNIIL